MVRYVYVSHGWLHGGSTRTDLDALGSVAIMKRGAEMKGLRAGEDFAIDLIDYYANGLDTLTRWRDCTLLVADIPPEALARPERPETTERLGRSLHALRDGGNRVVFIDHHPVEEPTRQQFTDWARQGLFADLDICALNADLDQARTHREKSCAAEMVLEWLKRTWNMPQDAVCDEIARLAHDQDFGVRAIPGANQISGIIGADFPPLEIIDALARGEFWSERFQAAWERQEEERIRQIGQLRYAWRSWRFHTGRELSVVYALMPPHDLLKVTPAAIHCLDRLGADIAVLIQRRSFISLRIRYTHNDLHAGRMLAAFGGGGHVGAASAGGRAGSLPYGDAHEENFEDVVEALDQAFSMRGGWSSRPRASAA